MALFPVIMCGGSGTRLWPASRPSRPKQFIPLSGNRSLFQETVLRVAPLVADDAQLVVVGVERHRTFIVDQLAELGVEAQILLEPAPRDSAAAMAAAATWAFRHDPESIVAFVASDHHVTDQVAFREAITAAAVSAALGRIVTLGIRPTGPSSAYGYIRPKGTGLSEVDSFVEKPTAALAADYIARGYLWNSGNFIAASRVLVEELKAYAPGVEAAAAAALPDPAKWPIQPLEAAFKSAPSISIDYAVMEKTQRASVLEVDYGWSDLGAWDALADSGEGDFGTHILEDAEGCVIRSPDGVLVAALGVRNLAIVVEADAVLVSDLSRSQDVKRVVERIRVASPQHLDFPCRPTESLARGGQRFADWMRMRALPLWSTLAQDARGAFADVLALDGRSIPTPRRARVQARQIYVYAQAGRMGWTGPWQRSVKTGLAVLIDDFMREDGLCRATVEPDGRPRDETVTLYDQAFVLFALATARRSEQGDDRTEAWAVRMRDALLANAQPNGALVEAGAYPYQSNAHMHLFEASMAWEAVSEDAAWADLSDRMADLALTTFIDRQGGFLREFFSADWTPARGVDGTLVEPGHQFEWAWLLERYGLARGRDDARAAARRLYDVGRQGIGERPIVAMDALGDDGIIRGDRARLWPQCEWLKASLLLAESARDGERARLLADAAAAQRALWLYLTPDGLWRDKQIQRGEFIDEPTPASSLYHIMGALQQLWETGRDEALDGLSGLSLK